MKTIMQTVSNGKESILLLMSIILCSFATLPGSDSVKIYLNNKLVLQEFLHSRKETPRLVLNPASDDQVSVEYNNCGKINTARKLILKNEENKIVKKWDFEDSSDLKDRMTFSVKEITSLNKGTDQLNLYYHSNELTDGQLLASVHLDNKTARKN